MVEDAKTHQSSTASRRGRQPIADVKSEFIAVRCTATEQALIDTAAQKAGLSIGAYVRKLALGSAGPRAVRRPPVERKELARLLGQLGKLGSNLNQLAHAYNREGRHPALNELVAMRKDINDLKDAILVALGRDH